MPANKNLPRSVLFVCTRNACRSPIAHALANEHFRRRVFIDSVGLNPGTLDGFSVAAMSELRLDISGHEPKSIDDVDLSDFDILITLTPESREELLARIGDSDITIYHWPTFDPSSTKGNREQILETYRHVREELQQQLEEHFPL